MARAAAVSLALVGVAFLAAACGGDSATPGVADLGSTTPPTQGAGAPAPSATEAQLLRYAECMRSHGITNFPDPTRTSNGWGIRFQASGNSDLDTPQLQAAQNDCQKLAPNKGGVATPAEEAAARTAALKYAECMRAHGEPNFPDPNGQGMIQIANPAGVLEPSAPQFQRATAACIGRDKYGVQEEIGSGPGGKGGPK